MISLEAQLPDNLFLGLYHSLLHSYWLVFLGEYWSLHKMNVPEHFLLFKAPNM